MTHCFNHTCNTTGRGYVALSTVSTLSFVMLVLAVGISQVTIFSGEQVTQYERSRDSRMALLSCISIVRAKIVEEKTGHATEPWRTFSLHIPTGHDEIKNCTVQVVTENALTMQTIISVDIHSARVVFTVPTGEVVSVRY